MKRQLTGIQGCMQVYIRSMGFWPAQGAVPKLVTDAEKGQFAQRRNKDNVTDVTISSVLDARAAAVAAGTIKDAREKIADFRKNLQGVDGTHATNMRSMGDAHLRMMFEGLADADIHTWNPGWLDHYATDYNKAHEDVAVETFIQIATSQGFNFMRLHSASLPMDSRLRKMYRHYVFDVLGQKVKDEERLPGLVAHQQAMQPVYPRRLRVCSVCLLILRVLMVS